MDDISDKIRLFLTQHWNGWSPAKILSHSKVVVPEINKGLTYYAYICRRIFREEKVMESWELLNLHSPLSVDREAESISIRLIWHAASVGGNEKLIWNFGGKSGGRRPLWGYKHRWEYVNWSLLKGCQDTGWILLAEDNVQWLTLAISVTKFYAP